MNQWGKKNVIEFYTNNRNKLLDLYKSEKIPLKKINRHNIKNILDYGCAAGGFYEIFKSFFKKNCFYHGLDTEGKIIQAALIQHKKNKNTRFTKIKKGKLNLGSNKYSLTFSTGVLNHNSDYELIIEELIRISNRYIFIDSPRVYLKKPFIGKLNLSKRFPSDIKNNNVVNNYTINFEAYLNFLKQVFKKYNIKYGFFYADYLPYDKKYLKINEKISFLTFLADKKNKKRSFQIKTKNNKLLKIFNKVFNS